MKGDINMEKDYLKEQQIENVSGGLVDKSAGNYYDGMMCPSCHRGVLHVETSIVYTKHGGFEKYYVCENCKMQFTD